MVELILKHGHICLLDNEDYAKLGGRWFYSDYVIRHIIGTYPSQKEYLHKLVLGAGKNQQVDHRDGNKLDCRKQNLRLCNTTQNNQNSNKKRINRASSKYKGVYWDKQMNKFRARIYHDGKTYHLGLFDNEIEAAQKYNKKALDLFGEFAKINKV